MYGKGGAHAECVETVAAQASHACDLRMPLCITWQRRQVQRRGCRWRRLRIACPRQVRGAGQGAAARCRGGAAAIQQRQAQGGGLVFRRHPGGPRHAQTLPGAGIQNCNRTLCVGRKQRQPASWATRRFKSQPKSQAGVLSWKLFLSGKSAVQDRDSALHICRKRASSHRQWTRS